MGEVDYVQKQQPKANGMQYSFVSHDSVTAKVRPLLHKHGVGFTTRAICTSRKGKVSEDQFRQLQAAGRSHGADLARFCKYFQVPSLKDVPASRFKEGAGRDARQGQAEGAGQCMSRARRNGCWSAAARLRPRASPT
jgi:hypothetical protein